MSDTYVPYLDDEPRLCPIHGCDVEEDGACEPCYLGELERGYVWDYQDEVDVRTDRDRDDAA